MRSWSPSILKKFRFALTLSLGGPSFCLACVFHLSSGLSPTLFTCMDVVFFLSPDVLRAQKKTTGAHA